MFRRVLAGGNCHSDHSSIARPLGEQFGAEFDRTGGRGDALERLRTGNFDLVLINRKLVGDGSEGLALIRRVKSDPQLAATPVMLLSYHVRYQEATISHRAEPGFGASEMEEFAILENLARFPPW